MASRTDFSMDNEKVISMFFLTAGGWVISLSEVEQLARIMSLMVPTVLSVLIYLQKRKK